MTTLDVVSVSAMPRGRLPGATARPANADPGSREWLAELRAEGAVGDAAVARLPRLLLRAARFEIGRRSWQLGHVPSHELDDLAVQAADDALVAVLARLDEFQGASRFTTWVYKFAVLDAAAKVRRRSWQGREVPLEPEEWPRSAAAPGADERAADQEVLRLLHEAMETVLTPHQRDVFVAVALNGVPLDVMAERLGKTRGALYKTLHDARRKLRRRLVDAGVLPEKRHDDRGSDG